MSARFILAIDLGTSGPKVALVGDDGSVVGRSFQPVDLILSPGGGAEQSPDDWWRAIVTATREALAMALVEPSRIEGIACTSQWSGTVPIGANGRHLANAIIWMDSRGAEQIARVAGGRVNVRGYNPRRLARWIRVTGGAPALAGKDPVAHILYLRAAHPEIYKATRTFLEPKDYLNYRLTGVAAASYDSIALHWITDNRDPWHIDYDKGLLDMIGLDRRQLPDLCRAVDVIGPVRADVARELGIRAGIPVLAGTPDVHACALGSGTVDDFDANLYLGTSSWLTCHVPFKKSDLFHSMASIPSAIPGRYLLTNEQDCAGACLTFLRRILFADDALGTSLAPEDVFERFDTAAATAPAGARGLVFTPWLYGERCPVDDHRVRGGFNNLSLDATRSDMVRSVLEGVALNSRWLLRYVERFIGRRLERITVGGGGARSDLWCQIHADVLRRPIRQLADPLGVGLRGAGVLAAVGLGWSDFETAAARVPASRIWQPREALAPLYDGIFREYVKIYRQNRAIHARLNGVTA